MDIHRAKAAMQKYIKESKTWKNVTQDICFYIYCFMFHILVALRGNFLKKKNINLPWSMHSTKRAFFPPVRIYSLSREQKGVRAKKQR